MAVVNNLWLRGTKQRLGGTVLYQQAGRTLQRELAPQTRNPRTTSQQLQRVKLANLVELYKAGRRWMPSSFQFKKRTWSDYNAFVSANLTGSSVYLTKQQAERQACVVAPVKITDGSLYPIELAYNGSTYRSNIFVGDGLDTFDVTVGELAQAIIANNNGVLPGDQLSFIQYIQQTNPDGTPYVVCRAYEMILDPDSRSRAVEYFPDETFFISEDGAPALEISSGVPMGGLALILSRSTGSTIEVSPEYITLTADNTTYAQYTTAAQRNEAINSYGQATDVFLSSRAATDISGETDLTFSLVSVALNNRTLTPNQNIGTELQQNALLEFRFNHVIPVQAQEIKFAIQLQSEAAPEIKVATILTPSSDLAAVTVGAHIVLNEDEPLEEVKIGVIIEGVFYSFNFKTGPNSMD